MKTLFILLFTIPFVASADSIFWQVPGSNLSIYAKNFKIEDVEVALNCKLGDSDSLFGASFPSEKVESELIHAEGFACLGDMYALETQETTLEARGLFQDFSSCSFDLIIYTDQERQLLSDWQIESGAEKALIVNVPIVHIDKKEELNQTQLPKFISLLHIPEKDQVLAIDKQ